MLGLNCVWNRPTTLEVKYVLCNQKENDYSPTDLPKMNSKFEVNKFAIEC